MSRARPDLLFDRTDVTFKAEVKAGCVVPFAGFPSLHVLPLPKATLQPIKLNCFGSPSRYQRKTRRGAPQEVEGGDLVVPHKFAENGRVSSGGRPLPP